MKKLIILLIVLMCSACDIYWTCNEKGETDTDIELLTRHNREEEDDPSLCLQMDRYQL